MNKILTRASLLAAACLAFSATASAQSPNGFASIIHIPVAVNTASFASTIFVHNPNGVAANVQFNYNGASITAGAGPLDCGAHSIAAGSTASFDLLSVCTLPAGSNFGTLRLTETSNGNLPIAAYTRVQSPVAGNGFSIEGFPLGGFANDTGTSVVLGLRRDSVAPGYQSNCFVSSIGEAVTVNVKLFDSSNTQLGTTQTVPVVAGDTIRMLDVFTVSGAPAGDYSNARAEFTQDGTTVGNPSFSAFCTVQNNTSFDADFRIAKNSAPDDVAQLYAGNTNKDAFGNNLQLPAGTKQIFGWYVKHPDILSCRVVGVNAGNAEIRVITPTGTIAAGGDDINDTGEFFTGEKSTVNNGTNGLWRVEVGSRDGNGLNIGTYVLQCRAGNGANQPILLGQQADDF
jgi:hypothetical protein